MIDPNCIFVLEQEFAHFAHFIADIHRNAPRTSLTYLISGFDGDFLASREPTFSGGAASRAALPATRHHLQTTLAFESRERGAQSLATAEAYLKPAARQ